MISGHQIHAYSAEISQIALQWAISQIHLPKDNKKISENKAVITNLCESVKLRKQAVKEGNGRGAGAKPGLSDSLHLSCCLRVTHSNNMILFV